jgi:hypothetical protein
MATTATPQLRQRTAFEIIDVSIQVFRRHYASFVMLVALGAIPTWIVLYMSGFMTIMSSMSTYNPAAGLPNAYNLGTFWWFPIASIWAWVVRGAVVAAASDAYLTGDLDPARALRAGLSKALPNIGVAILLGVALFFGAFALLVGAVYLYLRYFAVMPALMLEDKGVIESFHRSRDLSEGFKWRILGTLFLTWVIFWVVVILLQVVLGVVPLAPIARLLVNAVAQLFVAPLMAIVLVVLYYDQRIRKDGFDLEVMARDLAPVPA